MTERPASSARRRLPMLRIANLAVRALVLVLVGTFVFTGPWPGPARGALEIVAFAVATVLLALVVPADRAASVRGRHAAALPWALGAITLLCGAASAVPSGSLFVLLAVTATITAGSDAGLRAGCAVLALGVAGTVATGLALGASTSVTVEYPVVLLFGLVVGRNLQTHRLRAEQADQLREKQAALAVLDERTRIAREIHDVLAHSLGALGVQIQLARAVLTDQHDQTRAVAVLDQAQRMAADGLVETRRAVRALRGDIPPLPEGLAQLGVDHQHRHGNPVTFAVNGAPRPLSADAALAVTRTAQEALVNTAKHAPRQPVEIRLDYGPTATSLVVSNHLDHDPNCAGDGRLATVDGRYGLAGMRERLLLLDGTLSAGPRGSEWVVMAEVPQ